MLCLGMLQNLKAVLCYTGEEREIPNIRRADWDCVGLRTLYDHRSLSEGFGLQRGEDKIPKTPP